MTELIVFISQFLMVFLFGLQSLNFKGGHYVAAAITSFLLSLAGFYVIVQISLVKEMFTSIWWAYIFAGPFGAVLSMKLHPYFVRFLNFIGRKYAKD